MLFSRDCQSGEGNFGCKLNCTRSSLQSIPRVEAPCAGAGTSRVQDKNGAGHDLDVWVTGSPVMLARIAAQKSWTAQALGARAPFNSNLSGRNSKSANLPFRSELAQLFNVYTLDPSAW